MNSRKLGQTGIGISGVSLGCRTMGGLNRVNGHCLGRFWNIGPQQTLYSPGPWLKAGHNEVILLDVLGPRETKLAGLERPILDEVF